MSAPDLNLLVALDALLRTGSVAGAARQLGLSSSAMSRTLARLRAATGDPLLVRAGRALVPTPHALVLRGQVRGLLDAAQAVLRPPASGFDPAALNRVFTLRTNEGFVETFGLRLVRAVTAQAPRVRLHFAPKADKDVKPLRDGLVDLDIGVAGETAPELRAQVLFRDHFVGVVRSGHPLAAGPVTAEAYAAASHVAASRRGRLHGPVDAALGQLGLRRTVAVLVPGFPAALTLAREAGLVALVPASFIAAEIARQGGPGRADLHCFDLPVRTDPIAVSQIWHPRLDADPAHAWLRRTVRQACAAGAPGRDGGAA